LTELVKRLATELLADDQKLLAAAAPNRSRSSLSGPVVGPAQ